MKTTSLFGSMSFILMQSLDRLLMNNKSCFCMCDFEGSAHWELIFYFLNDMVIYKLHCNNKHTISYLHVQCCSRYVKYVKKKNMTLPYFSKCFIIIKRRKAWFMYVKHTFYRKLNTSIHVWLNCKLFISETLIELFI